jgi:MoaA/NifB/PqqE/SkfB family radical SAM enzyme
MKWKTYEKISCYFDFVNFVDLSGWGEPLLHKRIYDMVKMAKEKKCFVGFTTNGTLLIIN